MKPIRDQLAVVQRLIENQLRQVGEQPLLAHPDQFRALAALAETQLHLVRALESQPGKVETGSDDDPEDAFDSARLFDLVNHRKAVNWPVDDWECPACGGHRFQMVGAPSPTEVRPSDDKRFVLADVECRCHDCEFVATAGRAALSWHREQAGLAPLPVVTEWRERS